MSEIESTDLSHIEPASQATEQQPSQPKSSGWLLWLGWVLANALGLAIGGSVSEIVVEAIRRILGQTVIYAIGADLMAWIVIVFVVVFGQWLVLRQRIHNAGWWIPASALGAIIATGVSQILLLVADSVRAGTGGMIIASVEGGVVVGFIQWLALRRQVQKAGWWVLASSLGWGAGFGLIELPSQAKDGIWFVIHVLYCWTMGFCGDFIGYSSPIIVWSVLGVVLGVAYGVITGLALVWLLREPASMREVGSA